MRASTPRIECAVAVDDATPLHRSWGAGRRSGMSRLPQQATGGTGCASDSRARGFSRAWRRALSRHRRRRITQLWFRL